ncbi:MAG: alkaline phosphatase family protein [Alphaproteobacteria bacterium]|nr:alkaline phosphatase family protein [Alphaproteobacteria bacterium]
MKIKLALLFVICMIYKLSFTQKNSKPKLVIGIVIDQMRYDYLEKFKPIFGNKGFNRLTLEGSNCTNAMIPYLPTVTACGHACIGTGSVPSLHGITGNVFYDYSNKKQTYCVEDASVTTIGNNTENKVGKMSPKNLWTTTFADELKSHYNFKNKSFGISIKDRGAILPAGHAANAAYWYDSKTGNFVTSSYYTNSLPTWLTNFNNRNLVDSFYKTPWTLYKPNKIYEEFADIDDASYENNAFNKLLPPIFPYQINDFIKKDYNKINYTPFSNSILTMLAQELIVNENLGSTNNTDFLSISYSSPDYIGHSFGPNSWELLDAYLRLDLTIENLLEFLDYKLGNGNYTLYLTADHGVAPIAGYSNKHKIPSAIYSDKDLKNDILNCLKQNNLPESLVIDVMEYDLYLNKFVQDSLKLSNAQIHHLLRRGFMENNYIIDVVDKTNLANTILPDYLKNMIQNGYNVKRSGEIFFAPKGQIVNNYSEKGTSHSVNYNYDRHIPLIFFGWGIKSGNMNKVVFMTDIVSTLSTLLKIQEPSGCIGKPINEVLKH